MSKRKKSGLIKKMTSYLILLCILLAASIINFDSLLRVNKQSQEKLNQKTNIHFLLHELQLMVNDLDKYASLYQLSGDETFSKMYYDLIGVYKGELPRSSENYVIYNDITMSFRDIITQEMEEFDPSFNDDIEIIINNVDLYINYHRNTFLTNRGFLKLSSDISEYDTGNAHYDLNLKIMSLIDRLEYKFKLAYDTYTNKIHIKIKTLNYSLYIIITFTVMYLLYFLFNLYILFIKPIMEGHKLVEELSKGKTDLKWNYRYNNEFKDLVDSFNNYVDISQKSYKLIADQYYKLKVYSDVGEVNYFEYDVSKSEITVFYSKKFVERYHLDGSEKVYKVREYLKFIQKEDLNIVDVKLRSVLSNPTNEFKIDFRLRFPTSDQDCYLSCTGQRKTMGNEIFMGVQIDITDLKETQKRLLEQEEQYRIIVENSTDLIAKFDPLGNILYASKSYSDIFKHDHIIGANVSEFNKHLKVTSNNWIEKVKQPPYSSQEIILTSTDLGEKWISFKNDALLNSHHEVNSIISVGHDITEIKMMNDKLKYDSEHDLLTGLLNRRGLFNKMSELDITSLACFFIDINNFKNINDFYGHEIGDIIIKRVADELKMFSETCIISRLSGDEFVLLAPNYNTNFNLSLLKAQLNKNLQNNYMINNNNIFISSSVGYALYPEDTTDLNKLIPYADIAMYEAKIAQLKTCMRFTQEMFDTVNNKVELANDLKKAIDNDEFELVYQEIIDSKANTINFIETLVRWNHPKRGIIGPSDFIPVAKESGLMETLDMLIIRKSLVDYCDIREMDHYENTKLSINISPIMLLKKDFPSRLLNLVIKLGIHVNDICIEISENTFINNIEECRIQITKLRNFGFLVALDDFGREFSSLSILDRVDFDIIKIDRLFVNNLDHVTNIEIIKMIAKIAHLKNKMVIVEGVETNNQVIKLLELGCVLMQGYYFSMPHKILVTINN